MNQQAYERHKLFFLEKAQERAWQLFIKSGRCIEVRAVTTKDELQPFYGEGYKLISQNKLVGVMDGDEYLGAIDFLLRSKRIEAERGRAKARLVLPICLSFICLPMSLVIWMLPIWYLWQQVHYPFLLAVFMGLIPGFVLSQALLAITGMVWEKVDETMYRYRLR